MAFLMRHIPKSAFWAACIAFVLAFGIPLTSAADVQELNEQKVKAGLLYNFLKYTEWPANGRQILNVCLFQGDPFGGSLDPLKGRTAQQSRINVLSVSNVAELSGCSVVFLSARADGSVDAVLSYARRNNILTMSDRRGFAHEGGMVELAMKEDQHIHILINEAATQAAGIRIEPRMIKLAETVRQ